ncbi:MAG: hypothetical protein IKC42_03515 [Alistipes sp.]|nr:hypothetical protein [Alistipes sp.]
MKGINKRVTIAFVSIIALLSTAGVIALLELNDMSNDTQSILTASRRNMEIANSMLKSAHEHSIAMMHVVVFSEDNYRDNVDKAMESLNESLDVAITEASNVSRLDSLVASAKRLKRISDEQLEKIDTPDTIIIVNSLNSTTIIGDTEEQNRSLNNSELAMLIEQQQKKQTNSYEGWYDGEYKATYDNLISNIEGYMTHTHSSLAPRAEQLIKNTHRSIAPIFLTLVVMIAIMLMFYYFIRIYCVKPITKMNKALADYLVYRLPFNVKAELNDELKEMSDNIETLISQARQNNKPQ